jgi:hypothetical protein
VAGKDPAADLPGRQPVDVGRLDFLGAIAAEIPVPHVIGEDKDDVGLCFVGAQGELRCKHQKG